jgi:hypothetical protein
MISLAGGIFSIAYAQSATDVISNVTALIVATGSVMGAIAAIATSVVGIIKSKTGDKIISDKAYNDVTLVTQNLMATDRWIKENQANVAYIVSALSANSDVKKSLEDNGINMQALNNELNGLSEDLQRWHEMLPGYKPSSPSTA